MDAAANIAGQGSGWPGPPRERDRGRRTHQRHKVKQALSLFAIIQSIDRLPPAQALADG